MGKGDTTSRERKKNSKKNNSDKNIYSSKHVRYNINNISRIDNNTSKKK
jgi:hypothetical protein